MFAGVARSKNILARLFMLTYLRTGQVVDLSDEEMAALDGFHKKPGMHRSVCGFHSAELGGSCWGWTYEQLGWQMTLGGVHR